MVVGWLPWRFGEGNHPTTVWRANLRTHRPDAHTHCLGLTGPESKSKESDLELKLNELVVELGRSLQKIAQPIQSSMNRTLMSV